MAALAGPVGVFNVDDEPAPHRSDGRRGRPDAGPPRPARAAYGAVRSRVPRKRGGYVDANRFRLRFYEAQDRAGIAPHRTLHQLRHTFATVCASHGIPLRTIQGWCGHENYETTERYAHFLPRHEDAALVSAAFGARSAGAVQTPAGT